MANTTPIFTLTPVITAEVISTANTNRNGTGTIVNLITGSENGTRIHKITINALGSTTAGAVRLFINTGTNVRMLKEIMVSAITPSSTVSVWTYTWTLFGEQAIILPQNYILGCSTNNAESFSVIVEGGSY